MKKKIISSLFILIATLTLYSQVYDLPVPKKPEGWVNDYAKVFSASEQQALTRKLGTLEHNTSTQIFVVTIYKNKGYPVSMLAPLIGEEWGVGQDNKDNGLILLMDMEDKEVFITTGYGLEEYITDALAKRIVENEIIPAFKQNDYYGGVDAATDVMISLLEGKFTQDEYREQTRSSDTGSAIGGIIFMIIMFSIFFGGGRRRSFGTGGRGSNLPLWIALGMMSGNRSSGSFGNFSSGGGSFGGGGFGGFSGGGGGSFGGGGAGGSW